MIFGHADREWKKSRDYMNMFKDLRRWEWREGDGSDGWRVSRSSSLAREKFISDAVNSFLKQRWERWARRYDRCRRREANNNGSWRKTIAGNTNPEETTQSKRNWENWKQRGRHIPTPAKEAMPASEVERFFEVSIVVLERKLFFFQGLSMILKFIINITLCI